MSQQLLPPPSTSWRTRSDYGRRPSKVRPLGVTEQGRIVWEQADSGRFIVVSGGTAASFVVQANAVKFAIQAGPINRSAICTAAYGSPKKRGETLN